MNQLNHIRHDVQPKYVQLIGRLSTIRVVIASLFIATLFGYSMQTPSVLAQSDQPVRIITVVGEGKVTLQPDIARADIGVEVVSNTVSEASAQNKATIASVLSILAENGVLDKDIQTLNYNIYANRYGPEGQGEIEYRVSNMISVIIRDLNSVDAVLDAAIEAGANTIYGLNFQVEDPSSVESEVRKNAVEDARAKAEELASLTGVTVGDVISISEVMANGGFYAGNFEMTANDSGGGGGFVPGELGLVMRLQMTYAIVPAQEEGTAVASPQDVPQENKEEVVEVVEDVIEDVEANIDEMLTMFVAPETKPCVGVAPQDCLQIKFNVDDEWEFFYDQIEDFEFEPGFGYELIVTRSEVENPPADASSIRYTLVEVVEKIDVSSEKEGSALDGTSWTLSGIVDDNMVTVSDIDETITAVFGEERLSGSAACNTYSTTYSADEDSLELGPTIVTRMACRPEVMERESEFLAALGTITSYNINADGVLELSDAEGFLQLIFYPQ